MVRVEKPCPRRPERRLASAAPGMRQGLIPMCFQKSASSTATMALRSTGGMSRNVDHHPLLDRELAEDAAVGGEDLRDDVRLEVLERRDLGQVALEGEEDADERPAEDGRHEERGHDDTAQGQGAGGRHGARRREPAPPSQGGRHRGRL